MRVRSGFQARVNVQGVPRVQVIQPKAGRRAPPQVVCVRVYAGACPGVEALPEVKWEDGEVMTCRIRLVNDVMSVASEAGWTGPAVPGRVEPSAGRPGGGRRGGRASEVGPVSLTDRAAGLVRSGWATASTASAAGLGHCESKRGVRAVLEDANRSRVRVLPKRAASRWA